MKTLIWVDDYRPEPALHGGFLGKDLDNIIVCKTFRSAIDTLNKMQKKESTDIIYISLDHDLREKHTGYDIAKYMVENEIYVDGFYCHSMNPVGRSNINQLLTHYGYRRAYE